LSSHDGKRQLNPRMNRPKAVLATGAVLAMAAWFATGCSSEFPDHNHTRAHLRLTPASDVAAGKYTLVVTKQGVARAIQIQTGKQITTDVPAGTVTLTVTGLTVCPSALRLTGGSWQLVDLSLVSSSARCSDRVGP
jgi:hypothetical protein